MCSDLLSMLERVVILQIGRNTGRTESMAVGRVGRPPFRPTLDHPQHDAQIDPGNDRGHYLLIRINLEIYYYRSEGETAGNGRRGVAVTHEPVYISSGGEHNRG